MSPYDPFPGCWATGWGCDGSRSVVVCGAARHTAAECGWTHAVSGDETELMHALVRGLDEDDLALIRRLLNEPVRPGTDAAGGGSNSPDDTDDADAWVPHPRVLRARE